ncbi:hypothetical protein [Sporichthya polymorpha]|uniref:hypothetical protein n=1 Tax=Sporichthya polymorpha TaxID=35751 RepID=UPI00068809F1|nr:hypothetical protein [Sporichthya polymorpha]
MTVALCAAAVTSVMVAMPLGAAVAAGGLAEAAPACSISIESETPSGTGLAGLDTEQTANARAIVATVAQRDLPARAAVLALAAALQESSLRNLRHGHADSLGLFQQRPSQGWGTPIQVLDPVHATHAFLDRLVEVPRWQVRPLTRVVQAVQRSAYPDAYARWERTADELVSAALGRASYGPDADWPVQSVAADETGSAGPTEIQAADCLPALDVGSGCGFALARGNPRSCQNAVRWAVAMTQGPPVWKRRCLNFVAQAYGYRASGVLTAADFWVTAEQRYAPIPEPPVGSLVFWATDDPAGHVALSLGEGMVVSNDVLRPGAISVVPLSEIAERWGAYYLGWAPPHFPDAV